LEFVVRWFVATVAVNCCDDIVEGVKRRVPSCTLRGQLVVEITSSLLTGRIPDETNLSTTSVAPV